LGVFNGPLDAPEEFSGALKTMDEMNIDHTKTLANVPKWNIRPHI
jgi:hypothetical protein